MARNIAIVVTIAALLAGCLGSIGDRYYPNYGNSGYDVRHYDLAVTYNPANDQLQGVATITAKATADLTKFHLDLVGLTVHGVAVDGQPAPWTRDAHELIVNPRDKIGNTRIFTVIVDYSGIPTTALRWRLLPHRRRRDGRRPTGGRDDLVPGQRPSARQGDVHVPGHDTHAVRRRRQRAASYPDRDLARLDKARLGRA